MYASNIFDIIHYIFYEIYKDVNKYEQYNLQKDNLYFCLDFKS